MHHTHLVLRHLVLVVSVPRREPIQEQCQQILPGIYITTCKIQGLRCPSIVLELLSLYGYSAPIPRIQQFSYVGRAIFYVPLSPFCHLPHRPTSSEKMGLRHESMHCRVTAKAQKCVVHAFLGFSCNSAMHASARGYLTMSLARTTE